MKILKYILAIVVFGTPTLALSEDGTSESDVKLESTTSDAGDENFADNKDPVFNFNNKIEIGGSANTHSKIGNQDQFIRYMPYFTAENLYVSDNSYFDIGVMLNLFGKANYHAPRDGSSTDEKWHYDGGVDIHRLYARYYVADVMEFKLGLQELKFGSAQIFRPMSWFDTVTFTDRLAYTSGQKSFIMNSKFDHSNNLLLWGMYGNDSGSGYSAFKTEDSKPSFGGRFENNGDGYQFGLSFNQREVNINESLNSYGCVNIPSGCYGLANLYTGTEVLSESKVGFDFHADVEIGLWSEVSYAIVYDMGSGSEQYHSFDWMVGADYSVPAGTEMTLIFGTELFGEINKSISGDQVVSNILEQKKVNSFALYSTLQIDFINMIGLTYIGNKPAHQDYVSSVVMMWQQTYDFLLFGLNVFYANNTAYTYSSGTDYQKPEYKDIYGIQAMMSVDF